MVALIITASPSAVDPAPSRGDDEAEADEAGERAEAGRARRVLARDEAEHDDLERDGAGDHRRDARVDPRLGDVDEPDAEPEQEPPATALATSSRA